jgi:methionine synthase II (cobalamin-independent)
LLDLLAAREAAGEFDRAAYEDAVRAATTRTVERQVAAGIDVVNDGEQNKPVPRLLLNVGVIDSTANIVEHPEPVAERITRYASVVGREQLVGGVDCGFGTVARVQQVYEDVAYAKLRALAAGARLASTRSP